MSALFAFPDHLSKRPLVRARSYGGERLLFPNIWAYHRRRIMQKRKRSATTPGFQDLRDPWDCALYTESRRRMCASAVWCRRCLEDRRNSNISVPIHASCAALHWRKLVSTPISRSQRELSRLCPDHVTSSARIWILDISELLPHAASQITLAKEKNSIVGFVSIATSPYAEGYRSRGIARCTTRELFGILLFRCTICCHQVPSTFSPSPVRWQ